MIYPLSKSLILVILLASPSTATPSPSLPSWLNSTLPTKGFDIQDEIQCYGLPYGGIGFTSHVLTYYTLFMLSSDRSPWTWKRNKHWKFDLTLALIALLGTTVTSIFTIVRCRNRWQFVCIALWKMSMSIVLSAISTTAALRIRRNHLDSKRAKNISRQGGLYWLLLYIPGLVIGFAGLLSVVLQSWESGWVQLVTIHFLSMCSAFVALIILVILGLFMDRLRRRREGYTSTSIFDTPVHPQDSTSRVSPEQLFSSASSKPLLSHTRGASEVSGDQMDIPLIRITRDSMDISQSKPGHTPVELSNHKTSDPLLHSEKPNTRPDLDGQITPNKRLEAFANFITNIELPALSSLQAAIFGEGSGLEILVYIAGILVMPFLITIGIFGAFYSDFALGSIAKNMVGVPSGDNSVLYWGYFVFKRLPMLSA